MASKRAAHAKIRAELPAGSVLALPVGVIRVVVGGGYARKVLVRGLVRVAVDDAGIVLVFRGRFPQHIEVAAGIQLEPGRAHSSPHFAHSPHRRPLLLAAFGRAFGKLVLRVLLFRGGFVFRDLRVIGRCGFGAFLLRFLLLVLARHCQSRGCHRSCHGNRCCCAGHYAHSFRESSFPYSSVNCFSAVSTSAASVGKSIVR
ncbi:MAG: hypothetical protein DELT_01731 [Desulfovibrio sp.]